MQKIKQRRKKKEELTSQKNDQQEKKKSEFWSTFVKRAISALVMIAGFCALIYGGHLYVVLLALAVQIAMFYEINRLAQNARKEADLPGFRFISWWYLFVTLFFGYGVALRTQILSSEFMNKTFPSLLRYHNFISYSLYVIGLIGFVLLLKPGYYKYQFKAFAWTHMALFFTVVSLQFVVWNTHKGLIWFIIPVTLINVNDIFAYISGVMFGKTPLIALSPKKTWEGFIGAMIWTIIFGFILAEGLRHYDFMVCPKHSYDGKWLSCKHDAIFIDQEFTFNIPYFGTKTFSFAPIHIHTFVFSIFASIIAPFGGFFASGLKRSLNIKDFGDVIPGHGGIADRLDCQCMMGIFVFVYYITFIKPVSLPSLMYYIQQLSTEDQEKLLIYLKQILNK